jgi:hypothetical protein
LELQKINSTNNKIAFGTNKTALLNEMKHLYGVNYAYGHIDSAMKKADYIGDFFQHQKTVPTLEKIGVNPKEVEIKPHFLARMNHRIEEGRIQSLKWVVDALNNGKIFKEKDFDGFIIKGNNNVVLTLSKKNGHSELTSIFSQKELNPRWYELKS